MYEKRLLKLAKHLESGKLYHDKFHFSILSYCRGGKSCNTLGCALGECPKLFPKIVNLHQNGYITTVATDLMLRPTTAAKLLFDITEAEAEHLFTPLEQKPKLYGGKNLDYDATKEDVAANIRAFIKKKKGE